MAGVAPWSRVAAARNALGLTTEIIGVVDANSPSYSLSFRAQKLAEAQSRSAIAGGLACRTSNLQALEIIWENVERVVEVTDAEISEAMRARWQDTHNLVAEGAGAAALARSRQEKESLQSKRSGILLSAAMLTRISMRTSRPEGYRLEE
ncbi:MAG: pyridoxal-phosphate dependent enzyme [Terracidiphilus sp.]